MKTPTKVVLGFVVLAFASAFAALLIPIPDSWSGTTWDFYQPLFDSMIYSWLFVGAAALFLMGSAAYKAGMRTAYLTLAFGIALTALAMAQVPFLNGFGLVETIWVTKGVIMLPFIVSSAALFMGMRAMARQTGIRTVWTRIGLLFPVIIISIAASTFLPHVTSTKPEAYFDVSNAVVMFEMVCYIACLAIVWQLRQQMGAHYRQAMTWLAVAFLTNIIIMVYTLVATLLEQLSTNLAFDLAIILAGFIYLKAGHTFAKTKEV